VLRHLTRALALTTLLAGLASCSEEDGVRRIRITGAFDPDALDFGEVPLEMERGLPVTFSNTGEGLFVIKRVEVTPGFGLRGLKESLEGQSLQPAQALEFTVTYFPTAEGELTGALKLIGETTDVELPLRGVGVRRRIPVLSVDPASIDFGAVAVDTVARATVRVSNAGNAPATLDRVALRSTGDVVGPDSTFLVGSPLPVEVAEGASVELEVLFRPRAEGNQADVVLVFAQGVDAPLEITVRGQGLVPLGDILCEPTTVNFGRVERGNAERRDVTCTARGGPARLISAVVDGSTMFVLPTPPATIDLASEQSVTIPVEFRPDGLPATERATLRVNYTGGAGPATARVELVGEVVPPPPTATAMTVVMRWNTNRTDVDLHMVRPGGSPFAFDGSDCYYANLNPDWGRQGDSLDDPFLDVDDVDGMGPETMNLSEAAPGAYSVYAHYFGDRGLGPSNVTVDIFIAGQPAGTFTRTGLRCDELWLVGTINWNGASGTFAPSNQVTRRSEGVCGF
jgi:hypothetical protein